MFHANRWAGVFVSMLGENAEAGLLCLKAFVRPVGEIPRAGLHVLSGYSAARRLEKVLRESVKAMGGLDCPETTAEFVVRFVALLVEKGRFRHVGSVVDKIEAKLDAQNGVLAVTLEAAAPLDDNFIEEFKRRIAQTTKAAKVKMKTLAAPELLGGYRLQLGGLRVDASLKGRLEKMKTDLELAALTYGNQIRAAAGGA